MTNVRPDTMAVPGPRRLAVTVSLTGAAVHGAPARPLLEPHRPLPFGVARCDEFAGVMRALGFTVNDRRWLDGPDEPDGQPAWFGPALLTAVQVNAVVEGAFDSLKEADDLLVVHVLGDCEVEGGTHEPLRRVWLRGPDGHRLPADVASWRERAAQAPGRTLLILDVGAAVDTVAPEAYRNFTPHLGYWIIGAADGDGQTRGGELTGAVTAELAALNQEHDATVGPFALDVATLLERVHRRVPNTCWEPRTRPVPAGTARTDAGPARTATADVRAHLQHFLTTEAIEPTSGQLLVASAVKEFLQGDTMNLLVVTGKPGSGKSALINNAVRPHLPRVVIVDSRNQSLLDLIRIISGQLDPGGDFDYSQMAPVRPVLDAIMRRRLRDGDPAAVPIIVVDGFDRAMNRRQLVDQLLHPLAWWEEDGLRWCRLLVLARPDVTELDDLRPRDRRHEAWIDLGAVRPPMAKLNGELRAHLREQFHRRPLAGRHGPAVADALAAGMADLLAPAGDTAAVEPLPWGEHLVAELWLHELHRAGAGPRDIAAAKAFVAGLPRDVSGLVRLDLRRLNPRSLAIAWTMAFAQGEGWSLDHIDLIVAIAQRMAPRAGCDRTAITEESLRAALDGDLAFYVRRYPQRGGGVVVRLFHDAVAEEIQRDSRRSWTATPEEAP
ncbi:hypothetical protein [Actinoplanes derwentensis]|uniref:Uncharacterized protein n=1 Tax=Actinoplanes derwentensis TaxID=113562 RepID=A0A1H2AIU7_9ACTN|nr:hypothetical protein [Actinoplanes derwentensis]GID90295.1 hypothetical protein Ade03nite_92190 [Actinoplanes derwentensis]SDT45881.1 hypothetical protein SAMN04489716_3893 [Actinoplanes derwentensis]